MARTPMQSKAKCRDKARLARDASYSHRKAAPVAISL